MKKVYQVKGDELEEIDYFAGMDIYNGDVYGFDDPDAGIIWIWVGSKSTVEESTVAAWFVNKIDKNRGGQPDVMTIEEGEEPMIFRENWSINVIEGDTPGFLKKAELDVVEYKLYRVYIKEDTIAFDKAKQETVEISRDSLTSDDVYILDGNEVIYCWIGRAAQIEEKRMGQKIMQKIDADRHYIPLQYTIYEGDDDRIEEAFYELLDKLEKMDPEERTAISVEDTREQQYVAQKGKTVNQHKAEINTTYEDTDPDRKPKRIIDAGTKEHKNMLKDSEDELPKKGTVAARLAAINNRSKDVNESDSVPSKPSTTINHPGMKQKELSTTTSKHGSNMNGTSKALGNSRGRETSRTYGGAPEPKLGPLETGPPKDPAIELKEKEEKQQEEEKLLAPEPELTETDTEEEVDVPASETTTPVDEIPADSLTETKIAVSTDDAPEPESTQTPEPDIVTEDEIDEKVVSTSDTSKSVDEEFQLQDDEQIKDTKVSHSSSSNNPIKTDCTAINQHVEVWKAGNSCSVCGMEETDCPANEQHQLVWRQGRECVVCMTKP